MKLSVTYTFFILHQIDFRRNSKASITELILFGTKIGSCKMSNI